jgi:hypothetical protein
MEDHSTPGGMDITLCRDSENDTIQIQLLQLIRKCKDFLDRVDSTVAAGDQSA